MRPATSVPCSGVESERHNDADCCGAGCRYDSRRGGERRRAERPSYIALHLRPAVDFPVAENATFYQTVGGSGRLGAAYQPPIGFPLTVDLDLTYGLALVDPTALPAEWRQGTDKSLHTFAVSAGVGSEFPIAGRLEAGLYAHGGYYYGLTEDDDGNTVAGGNPYVTGGGQLQFRLTPELAVGLGASGPRGAAIWACQRRCSTRCLRTWGPRTASH